MAKAKELDIIMHYFIFACFNFELNTSDFVDSSKKFVIAKNADAGNSLY